MLDLQHKKVIYHIKLIGLPLMSFGHIWGTDDKLQLRTSLLRRMTSFKKNDAGKTGEKGQEFKKRKTKDLKLPVRKETGRPTDRRARFNKEVKRNAE